MWLVLCMSADEAARWAYARLREVGPGPVELVTDLDLVGARWEHRIRRSGAQTVVSLTDGRVIDSRETWGALNRFVAVPPAMLAPVAPADRDYAASELSALFMSWLAGLGGPVLNPASARGLSGAWRQTSEWAMLASTAGLPTTVAWVDSAGGPTSAETAGFEAPLDGWHDWPPFAHLAEDVIVVGGAVFAREPLTPAVRRACRSFARLTDTPLLGLRFGPGGATRPGEATRRGGATRRGEATKPGDLVSVTTLPDLRAGGPSLVAALAEAMGMAGAH